MAVNFLEQLLVEWYECQGYYVRRNVRAGKRDRGGYACELDVVAYRPNAEGLPEHLVHLEASTDSDSWTEREKRFKRKFDAGRMHIRKLFPGFELSIVAEQIAVFAFGSDVNHKTIGGGKVLMLSTLLSQITTELRNKTPESNAVPETYNILRTLQF